jgi:alpha-tubulin suppressor-like RCC1 family protein
MRNNYHGYHGSVCIGALLLLAHMCIAVPNCVVFGYNPSNAAGTGVSGTPIYTATYVQDVFSNNNVVAVAPGQQATYFLSANGTFFSTGLAQNGRLGTNTTSAATFVDIQIGRSDIKAIAAGYANGYAITTDGTVLAWGNANYKALGRNTVSNALYPQPIVDGNNVIQGRAVKFISSGLTSVGIITTDGSLLTFGTNGNGQLGDGTTIDQYCPINVVDGLNVIQGRTFAFVHFGYSHAVAITTNGSVLTWGDYKGVGRASNTHYPGYITDTNSLMVGRTFVNAAAGGSSTTKAHTIMVANDGKVFAVGDNNSGQLCTGDTVDANTVVATHSSLNNIFIVKANVGSLQTYLLSSNGTVYVCGYGQKYVIFYFFLNNSFEFGAYYTDITVPMPMTSVLGNFTVTDMGTAAFSGYSPAFMLTGTGPTTPSPTTTVAPTTAMPTTTAVPTTTATPTPVATTTTVAPTTVVPTTTAVPTTTVTPTTTLAPTTTSAPSPTAEPTTTTSSTIVPTTTITPTTTTLPPTTTQSPATTLAPTTNPPTTTTTTTQAPSPSTTSPPTNPPVTVIATGTLSTKVESGDIKLVPPPVSNTSVVLISSANVTVTLPITLSENASVPIQKTDTLVSSTVSFNVTSLPKPVQISVILTFDDGTQAGKVTVTVSSARVVTVDMKDLLITIRQMYQQDFVIRAIRGAILKVSLGIDTPDVPVNIDQRITTSVVTSTVATDAPTTITPTTNSPLSPKPTLSYASRACLNATLFVLFMLWF